VRSWVCVIAVLGGNGRAGALAKSKLSPPVLDFLDHHAQ